MRRSLLILSLLAIGLPAYASDWYPIDTGRYWVYTGPSGLQSDATIDATESFSGTLVQPMRWNSGIRDLLAEDGTGRVFLHGQDGAPDGSYVVFESPILLMESDLTPGQEWETSSEFGEYDADGVEFIHGQHHYTAQVVAIGPVNVPAGTFVAAEVLVTVEVTAAPVVTEASSDASYYRSALSWVATLTMYYADGVGWIRRTEDGVVIYDLLSYGPNPLSTQATTWGAVKAIFRE